MWKRLLALAVLVLTARIAGADTAWLAVPDSTVRRLSPSELLDRVRPKMSLKDVKTLFGRPADSIWTGHVSFLPAGDDTIVIHYWRTPDETAAIAFDKQGRVVYYTEVIRVLPAKHR
jgi:hypothetical protein